MDSGDSGNQYCMTKHGCSYPQIVYWLRVSGVWNYPIRWAYIKCSPSILYSVFILDDNVLIVIGGDSYYRDENEEVQSVISRWARKKLASQFREEYLDGKQNFIFSWDKNTEWFTRKQCGISLIMAKGDPSLNADFTGPCQSLYRLWSLSTCRSRKHLWSPLQTRMWGKK